MHSESEGKYMETYEAEVAEDNKEQYLVFKIPDNRLSIPLTKDVPIDVQKVFNHFIVALKRGVFKFSIEDKKDGDIFYHIAKEYISQLNAELLDIYNEMDEHGLLEKAG